jgi:GNAT superfamily N-acetyltransferase
VNRPLVVRHAEVADAAALKVIRQKSLSDEPDAYSATYAESLRYRDSHWREMAEHWNYYLAFDGPDAVGMAAGGPYSPKPDHRWLYGMYVTPEFRGTGIAQRLVAEVATWARGEGVDLLGLHVTATQSRARAFYEKIGFALTGESEPMRRDPRLVLLLMSTDLRVNDRI